MTELDAFRHHPGLIGKIRPAEESYFRTMDLAEVDARAAALGREPGWRTPCAEREAGRHAVLEGRWDQDLWVFAYGSLMWDPALEFTEVRRARTDSYCRRFCLWDDGGRGTPTQPGLQLALDTGGRCEGLAFRVAAADMGHETFVLFRREMIARAYTPVWMTLDTAQGPIEALGFAANHDNERIKPDLPLEDQAYMIAKAEGFLGTNFEYLEGTHERLEMMGIEDPYIAGLFEAVSLLRAQA